MEAAAGNGLDAGAAIVDLETMIREADTLPELPPDAEARDIALAYANLAAAAHERVKMFTAVLRALHEDNVLLERRQSQLRRELASERVNAQRRHDEICALLKTLGAG